MTKEEIQRIVSLAVLNNNDPCRDIAIAQWGRYNDSMRNVLRPALADFWNADHRRIITTRPTGT